MKASVLLTILTSASASLCCIIPALTLIGGAGSVMSSVSWLEPFRPFFIGATFILLGFAWYNSMRIEKKDECGCEPEKRSLFQTRKFLGIITVISLLLLSFPSYSRFLLQSNDIRTMQEQDKNKRITISVNGMTCASCEKHIESEVIKLSGVVSVKASYEQKSATIHYNPEKVNEKQIIEAINETGYSVNQDISFVKEKLKADCCTKGTCTPESCANMPKISLPNEKSRNLKILNNTDEIKEAFNKQSGKVKFVAILSSTCGWCLQGAESVQQGVIENMKEKNVAVIIVWTNMLKADDKESAYKAASLFKDPSIVQFFDEDNKFGDIVAKRLNPEGKKAWDIYLFYDQDARWEKAIPRPFEYAHQLSANHTPWADQTKYFCGKDLTKRLSNITANL
jgi:mercuric ion transport protein